MRINRPHSKGISILSYNGSRRNLQNIQSRYFNIYAYGMKELIQGTKEILLVPIRLSDGNEIAISLISHNLYTSSKSEGKTKWNYNDENYAIIYSTVVDDNTAIFEGSFFINSPFHDDFIEDKYDFTIIFTPSEEIKYYLRKNKIEFGMIE